MTQRNLIKKVSLLALALLVIVVSLSGCGDDDGGTAEGSEVTVETSSLTKAQFIDRADSICQQSEEKLEKVIGNFLKSFTANPAQASVDAQAATLVNTVMVPSYEKLIEELRALGAPSGDEQEVSAFLTSLRESLEAGEEQPLKFVQSREPFVEGVKLSKAYGFNVCLA